jgi:hypothetical protein
LLPALSSKPAPLAGPSRPAFLLALAAILLSWANSLGKKAKKISNKVDILQPVAAGFLPAEAAICCTAGRCKKETWGLQSFY